MRRILLFALLMTVAGAYAEDGHHPMLEQSKTWHYTYHHFDIKSEEELTGDEKEEIDFYHYSSWMVDYTLLGDTTINGRQYMKMYRIEFDEHGMTKSDSYYAAYREEDGKVYEIWRGKGAEEHLLLDFSLKYDGKGFQDAVVMEDSIKVNNRFFRRYHYQNTRPDGSKYKLGYVGIEGVGFKGYGLVHYLFEPQYACLSDYESFDYVYCGSFFFQSNQFNAPRWLTLSQEEQSLVEQNNNFAFNL